MNSPSRSNHLLRAASIALAIWAVACTGGSPPQALPFSCDATGLGPSGAPDFLIRSGPNQGQGIPRCDLHPTDPDNGIDDAHPCVCGDYDGYPAGVFDQDQTVTSGATIVMCKDVVTHGQNNAPAWAACSFEAGDAFGVEASGYIVGKMGAFGPFLEGVDDDVSFNMCPIEGKLGYGSVDEDPAMHIFPLEYGPMELRDGDAFHYPPNGIFDPEFFDINIIGRLHIEVQGCRFYDGSYSVQGASGIPTRGGPGDLVTAAGDWVIDTGHAGWTEIHEARAIATVHQLSSSVYLGFISSFFADSSFQQDSVMIDIKVPRPADSSLNKLNCSIMNESSTLNGPNDVVLSTQCPDYANVGQAILFADSTAGTCRLELIRPTSVAPHAYLCEGACSSLLDIFPCPPDPTCVTTDPIACEETEKAATCMLVHGHCEPRTDRFCSDEVSGDYSSLSQYLQCQQVQYAGVVRAEWTDPGDVWMCSSCACDDPSSANASISAPVQGCAEGGLDPSSATDQLSACQQVCGGKTCGAAPACDIGTCAAPVASTATLLARGACDPSAQAPALRVSDSGDYHVTMDASASTATISFSGTTVTGAITGSAFLNRDSASGILDISSLRFSIPSFGFNGITISDPVTFEAERVVGQLQSSGQFVIPADTFVLGVRGVVSGVDTGATLSPLATDTLGTLDLSSNSFSVDFAFSSPGLTSGTVTVHIQGTIDNVPPHASAGPSTQTFECTSTTTTPVKLDASPSSDPDAGDTISHYQWFTAAGDPLGNSKTVTVPLLLGQAIDVVLHVYDAKLGSDMTSVHASVVDTTPPSLAISPTSLCLLPPDHQMQCFSLGGAVQAAATDTCDPSPTVQVVRVTSNQPDNGTGDGDTAGDVSWTSGGFCVRRERAGTLGTRTYTVSIQASDHNGNTTTKTLPVTVPRGSSCP